MIIDNEHLPLIQEKINSNEICNSNELIQFCLDNKIDYINIGIIDDNIEQMSKEDNNLESTIEIWVKEEGHFNMVYSN